MPNSIEIFENTLLKLVVRRGSDSERRSIVLTEGELGYSTDIKRLFVGDGVTAGGSVTGNKYLGSNADVTTFTNAIVGDYAHDTDNNRIYILETHPPTNINNWRHVASLYTAGDNTIRITNDQVFVNVISAGNLDPNIFDSFVLSGASINIGTDIYVDSVNALNTTTLTLSAPSLVKTDSLSAQLPANLIINSQGYKWPASVNSGVLSSGSSGTLRWAPISALSAELTLTATIDGGTVLFTNPLTIYNDTTSSSNELISFDVYPNFTNSASASLGQSVVANAKGLIIDYNIRRASTFFPVECLLTYAPTLLNLGSTGVLASTEYMLARGTSAFLYSPLCVGGQATLPLSSISGEIKGHMRCYAGGAFAGESSTCDLTIRAVGYTY